MALSINWSFSKLDTYENCALRFKLQYIDKAPQLPLAPDNPMERGNRVHNRLELFVKGEGPMDHEARHIDDFVPALHHAQDLYAANKATVEENWFVDRDWNVCPRDGVWLWSKLDLNVTDEDEGHSIVVDYKTGKSMYKAVSHIQQMQLYAAVTAIRQEWADKITVELWYLDEGITRTAEFTREEALKLVGRFDGRAQRIYDDKYFRPNPNKITCAYCPYGPKRGTGACPVGV